MAQATAAALKNIAASETRQAINPEPSWDWGWRLTGAETPEEREICATMLRHAREFVADMAKGSAPRWLVLVGYNGCGKSYLARRIVEWVKQFGRDLYEKERARDGHTDLESLWSYAQEGPMFRRWQNLLSLLREGKYHKLETDCEDWFKVIDDLGVGVLGADGEITSFAMQKMGELLDRRLRKWTVITTNFSRRQIAEDFDLRVASRLIRDGNVICDCGTLRDWALRAEAAELRPLAGQEAA
jgi:hypothetical protein